MKDIHLRVDDDLFNRWQNCTKHYGQRAYIARKLVREAIEFLEKQVEPEAQLKLPIKSLKS